MLTQRDIGMGKKSLEEVIADEANVLCADIALFNGKPIDNIRDLLGMSASYIVHYVEFGYRWYLIVGNMLISWRNVWTLTPTTFTQF